MISLPRHLIALFALIASLALASCGGDDEPKSGGSGQSSAPAETQADGTTTQETVESETATEIERPETVGGEGGPKAADIIKCFKSKDSFVIENPGTDVGANFHLVVDGGGGGIVYGYDDEADAKANLAKVDADQKSAGRKSEVLGATVISNFPAGAELATAGSDEALRECAQAG